MRIGLVTLCYQPVVNGVVQMVEQYKQELTALGHEVSVFTFSFGSAHEEDGVFYSPGVPLGTTGYFAAWRYSALAVKQMQTMDIVHTHHLFMTHELIRPFLKCPIVYTNHTRYDLYAAQYFPLPKKVSRKIIARVWPYYCQFADCVVAPSESVAHVMRHFGVRQPIERIENGIDLRPFHTPASPLTKTELGIPETAVLLTYVGRLSYEKNVEFLIKQFACVAELIPDAHLMLVGDGPTAKRLRQKAKQLRCSRRIHFMGQVPHTAVPNYLFPSDIFVTASTSEVHPLTLIEAMAAGLPIIAPNAPGNYDIVRHGKSGILVEQNKRAFANAMLKLLQDDALRMSLSQCARAESEHYNITRTIDKTLALYDRLLGQKSASTPVRERDSEALKL